MPVCLHRTWLFPLGIIYLVRTQNFLQNLHFLPRNTHVQIFHIGTFNVAFGQFSNFFVENTP